MKDADRMALVHMLLAQREQINAALRLLAPAPPGSGPPEAEPRRPLFMGDDAAPQPEGGP